MGCPRRWPDAHFSRLSRGPSSVANGVLPACADRWCNALGSDLSPLPRVIMTTGRWRSAAPSQGRPLGRPAVDEEATRDVFFASSPRRVWPRSGSRTLVPAGGRRGSVPWSGSGGSPTFARRRLVSGSVENEASGGFHIMFSVSSPVLVERVPRERTIIGRRLKSAQQQSAVTSERSDTRARVIRARISRALNNSGSH